MFGCDRFMTATPLRLLTALGLAAALAKPGVAQAPRPATIGGRVVDKTTRMPIVSAQVGTSDTLYVTSDSLGRFVLTGLAPGPTRLVVRASGFPVARLELTLRAGDDLEPVIQLDSTAGGQAEAQVLPRVAVTTTASLGPRFADFERRQKTGRGQYLTREQIARAGNSSLQETLRTMRGVNVDCGGGGGCYIRMARAPMRCLPEYIVDERVDNSFGPRTPLQDIEAVEVYTGPADVPGEFAGRNAGCGVIVIWTKSGPPRRRP